MNDRTDNSAGADSRVLGRLGFAGAAIAWLVWLGPAMLEQGRLVILAAQAAMGHFLPDVGDGGWTGCLVPAGLALLCAAALRLGWGIPPGWLRCAIAVTFLVWQGMYLLFRVAHTIVLDQSPADAVGEHRFSSGRAVGARALPWGTSHYCA